MSFTPFPNEIYTTFSFFGLIMCIILLPCHLKAWNVGTSLLMFWAGIGCLIFFVNSIVWHGNTFNSAPIWCDICAKIILGTLTGMPASSLCINRRLYLLQLNPAGNFAITKSDKIRFLAIDLVISFGLPVLLMSLHYVYQGHRFDIFEDIGCYPENHNTWVALLLVPIPPVLLGLVSATYGIRAIISINKSRNQFNELLARRLNITSSLYFRLMCYAGSEALITTPIGVYFLVYSVTKWELYPWISWEISHSNVNRVGRYPAIKWHTFPPASAYEFLRWIHVILAFLFFLTFGFTQEAKSRYRLTVKFFLKLIGIRVDRQTEILGFQTGTRSPMSQSDPPERLIFDNKSPHQGGFSTIPRVSIFPNYGRSGREQLSPSSAALRGTQYCAGSQTGPDSPGNSPTNPRVPEAVKRWNERTPSIRNTRNLRSFLNLGHNDSSPHFAQMDISTVEEGQLPEANRSSNRSARPFRSFLNLN